MYNIAKYLMLTLVLFPSQGFTIDFSSLTSLIFERSDSRRQGPYCERFNEVKNLTLKGKPLVLVTHPQSGAFDVNSSSFRGNSMVYNWMKRFDIETVVLVENSNPENYFSPTCNPDAFFHSDGGEFNFDIKNPTIVLMGGFFSACLRQSVEDIFLRWKPKGRPDRLRLILPMEAIYDIPYPLDGSNVDDSKYSARLESYYSVTGTRTMNLLQVSRLMGPAEFIKRVLIYFSPEGAVIPGLSGPEKSRLQLPLPPNQNIELTILSHTPEMNFSKKLQSGNPALPTIEINLVDYGYLISATNHLTAKIQ